ncbi:MAG: hypothetical protein DMG12_14890 [Acidobacteria bacterium]|nr:MAG: hypothetical protein DMG12_14890 [Acidobacteriota bacterium]
MRFTRGFIGSALALALVLVGCQQPASQTPAETPKMQSAKSPTQSPVERGRYMVTVGGCNDCHTPKMMGPNGLEPDMSRTLSGNPSTEKLAKVPAGLIAPDKYLTITNNHLGAWVGP